MSVTVRPARRGDVRRIIEIERSWHHLSHWSPDSYYRLVDDTAFASGCVAEVIDEAGSRSIEGFVIFHVSLGTAEIYNIAVERTHARTGIGEHLMRAAIESARNRLAQRMVLEVRKTNVPAITFYRKFDFRIAGERKEYYSNPIEDAYVMERSI